MDNRIRELRKEKGMNQDTLAGFIRMGKRQLTCIMSGNYNSIKLKTKRNYVPGGKKNGFLWRVSRSL